MNDPASVRETASAIEASEVVSTLSRQLVLFERLRRLVERQHELISHEDPSALIALLAERQGLTQDLVAASARLAPARRDWPRVREQLSEGQRVGADAMLRRVEEHLTAIVAADSRDVKRLEVRKRRVSAEMRAMPAGGAMLSAYGRSQAAPATTTIEGTDEQA